MSVRASLLKPGGLESPAFNHRTRARETIAVQVLDASGLYEPLCSLRSR